MTFSWKPKREGKLYCSPACGGGCTHAQYVKAHKLADRLIKKCEKQAGGKWEKRVHENLGWHYCVSLVGGNIAIMENKDSDKPYSVASHVGGTPSQIFIRSHSKSIKWLVDKQLRMVQKEADKWNNYLSVNKKALDY